MSRVADSWRPPHLRVLSQTVLVKPTMVCATRNATRCPVNWMVGTVPSQQNLGLTVRAAGIPSITASVMIPATTLNVSMTTLTAKTRRRFASKCTSVATNILIFMFERILMNILLFSLSVQYMKPTVLTTMLMDDAIKAATQRSVDGMVWTAQ